MAAIVNFVAETRLEDEGIVNTLTFGKGPLSVLNFCDRGCQKVGRQRYARTSESD